ncbi:ABC transporter ATP-binding protein [Paraglaciecola aestuariivivens]
MPKPANLIAKQVNLTLGQQQVLADVSLNVVAGQVLGVLGPNGAGKTSLLKMLSGQIKSQGKISWQSRLLDDYEPMALARQVAVVNQLNEQVFALNLQQIVSMGLLPHKSLLSREDHKDRQRVAQALAVVGLADKAQQSFASLSGGEQQRGLIARGLVQQAKLFVLDEPVNHLDVYYQHQVMNLLQSLAHQLKLAVVISLHDLNLAAHYCDQLCLLDKGKVAAVGTPAQVLTTQRLEQVFNLPCQVQKATSQNSLRIEFFPPEQVAFDLMATQQADSV